MGEAQRYIDSIRSAADDLEYVIGDFDDFTDSYDVEEVKSLFDTYGEPSDIEADLVELSNMCDAFDGLDPADVQHMAEELATEAQNALIWECRYRHLAAQVMRAVDGAEQLTCSAEVLQALRGEVTAPDASTQDITSTD